MSAGMLPANTSMNAGRGPAGCDKPYLTALNQAIVVAAGVAHGQRLVKDTGIGQVEAVQVDVGSLVVVAAIVLVVVASGLAVGIQHPGVGQVVAGDSRVVEYREGELAGIIVLRRR